MRPTPGLLLLCAAALLAGCAEDGGPDFDVQVYNDSAEPVEVRFRATHDGTQKVVLDRTVLALPGHAILGHLDGPDGDYHLEAWAFGEHDEMGPGMGLGSVSSCSVYLANPDPVSIQCVVT